jgi:hypothetical protein
LGPGGGTDHPETAAKCHVFLGEGSDHQISICCFQAYRCDSQVPFVAVSFALFSLEIDVETYVSMRRIDQKHLLRISIVASLPS